MTDEQFIAAATEAGLEARKVKDHFGTWQQGVEMWVVTLTAGAQQAISTEMVERVDIPSAQFARMLKETLKHEIAKAVQ